MELILELFYDLSSKFAILSLFYPIITLVNAIKKKERFSNELKLFRIYIFITFLMQIVALFLARKMSYNLIVFKIYLPFHTAVFTYLLLKWLRKKKIILWTTLVIIISLGGDFLTSSYASSPNFMIWFDSALLFVLSFLLSYVNDKKKIHLAKENSYIHLGIYLYSIITLIGLSPSFTELRLYGFFLQSMAIIVSSYFFGRSFRCLYHSNG